jgi:hypothetical protein
VTTADYIILFFIVAVSAFVLPVVVMDIYYAIREWLGYHDE